MTSAVATPNVPPANVPPAVRDEIIALLPNLRAFARTLTRNVTLSDDLVQDTVVKAWSHIERFELGTDLRAWLFTILRNHYYSLRRKYRREVEDIDGKFSNFLATQPAQTVATDLLDFWRAFAKLNDEQREALTLVGASGFSYDEAAAICGCAVGTIKSRVNRARSHLAEQLNLPRQGTIIGSEADTIAESRADAPIASPR